MPTAPDAIIPTGQPAAPTAPGGGQAGGLPAAPTVPVNAAGAGAVAAPSAPGGGQAGGLPAAPTSPVNAAGAGTVSAPTSPAEVVPPFTSGPAQAIVSGALLDGLGASFAFAPLLYAGEYSGRPYYTADGLPVAGFTGNGSYLWYDTTQWKLSHKVAQYGTPLARWHAASGSEMSPDAVTTWVSQIGSGTPVVTVENTTATPAPPSPVQP